MCVCVCGELRHQHHIKETGNANQRVHPTYPAARTLHTVSHFIYPFHVRTLPCRITILYNVYLVWRHNRCLIIGHVCWAGDNLTLFRLMMINKLIYYNTITKFSCHATPRPLSLSPPLAQILHAHVPQLYKKYRCSPWWALTPKWTAWLQLIGPARERTSKYPCRKIYWGDCIMLQVDVVVWICTSVQYTEKLTNISVV